MQACVEHQPSGSLVLVKSRASRTWQATRVKTSGEEVVRHMGSQSTKLTLGCLLQECKSYGPCKRGMLEQAGSRQSCSLAALLRGSCHRE